MISILISLILWGLVFYVLNWALSYIALPEPFAKVAQVILVVAAVLVVLGLLTGASWSVFPLAKSFRSS